MFRRKLLLGLRPPRCSPKEFYAIAAFVGGTTGGVDASEVTMPATRTLANPTLAEHRIRDRC